jgi:hypothetical protein
MMSQSRILRLPTSSSYCEDALRPAAIQSSNARTCTVSDSVRRVVHATITSSLFESVRHDRPKRGARGRWAKGRYRHCPHLTIKSCPLGLSALAYGQR